LDIRIETSHNQIYLSHEMADAYNKKTGKNYLLSDAFDEAVDFVRHNTNETVIMHLKDDNINGYYKDNLEEFAKAVTELSYFNDKYKEGDKSFFYTESFNIYNMEDKNHKPTAPIIPTLGLVRVVILMCQDFYYKNDANTSAINSTDSSFSRLGIQVDIPDMGTCRDYDGPSEINLNNAICFPIICKNNLIRVQDNYNMDLKDKWSLVNDMLDHKSRGRTAGSTWFTIYDENNVINSNFYNTSNIDVLTINFMNIQANAMRNTIKDTISYKAKYMNNNLSDNIKKNTRFHNEWFILDFPTNDLIPKIWKNNFIDSKEYKNDNINVNT